MRITLHLLVDEDFDNDIVRGLLRRLPTLDMVRALDEERDKAIENVKASVSSI
jgi:hypothetical protein